VGKGREGWGIGYSKV